MTNFEKIKRLNEEELAMFLYINLSKKGKKKTAEWLKEEVND
jgi:hypothetical protein